MQGHRQGQVLSLSCNGNHWSHSLFILQLITDRSEGEMGIGYNNCLFLNPEWSIKDEIYVSRKLSSLHNVRNSPIKGLVNKNKKDPQCCDL